MSGLFRSVECVVVNDTEFELVATGKELNWELVHGSFDGGIDAPPCPIPAHSHTSFVSSTAGLFTGTEGWVCYALRGQDIVVQIAWNEPFIGDNSYALIPNVGPAATRELDAVDITFMDRDGRHLAFEQAKEADDVVAIYTIRLKPVAAPPAGPPPNPEKAPEPVLAAPIAATPSGQSNVSLDPELPEWAKKLSNKRKRMFATLAKLLPQAVDGKGTAPYGQGGTVINSNTWWNKDNTMTSCTSFNPKVMKAYFAPKACPYEYQWGFTPGGQQPWKQTLPGGKVINNPKVDPQPGWKLFKDNATSLPKPGDTYTLWNDVAITGSSGNTLPVGMRHVGIVVYVPDPKDPDDCWVTADGGQGQGKAQRCELVPRGCIPRAPTNVKNAPDNTPHFGGGAEGMKEPLPRLYGWVDLEDGSLAAVDETYSEADFKDLVMRIEAVRAYYKKTRKPSA